MPDLEARSTRQKGASMGFVERALGAKAQLNDKRLYKDVRARGQNLDLNGDGQTSIAYELLQGRPITGEVCRRKSERRLPGRT